METALKTDDPPRKKSVPKKGGGGKNSIKWALKLTALTFSISVSLSFISSQTLENVGYILAFSFLAGFILLGIAFDIVGVAVTSADARPFHSMAARRVKGSIQAIRLVRNAEKISSICLDVIGDICGIISGTTSAIVVARMAADFPLNLLVTQLLASGVVAGLTIGGKALGKSVAIRKKTNIVLFAGRIIYFFQAIVEKIIGKGRRDAN